MIYWSMCIAIFMVEYYIVGAMPKYFMNLGVLNNGQCFC